MSSGSEGAERRQREQEAGTLNSVRRRKNPEQTSKENTSESELNQPPAEKEKEKKERSLPGFLFSSRTFWLTRIVFVRSLGFIYFVAFLVAYQQNKELLGTRGLLPINLYLDKIRTHFKVPPNVTVNFQAFSVAPTLLWWVPLESMDLALDVVALTGMVLAFLLVMLGSGNALIFGMLWIFYHSLVNVGQRWYSFGWESQLLETGFLAIFLCPLLTLNPLPRATPTPLVVIWGYRWLLFRIMLGAGLIKIRGDQCWKDLTCMNYHYETQPVPNPLSYYLHQSPEIVHKAETLGNHIVELVVPFFILLPRPFLLSCGLLQIFFQVVIILSGNFSFLNWLTILPSIFIFDDDFLRVLFSSKTLERLGDILKKNGDNNYPIGYYVRKGSSFFLGLLLAYLSIPVVQNLLSSKQMMNTSFDSLRIVNTYGAFGSITKKRTEVILEGTLDTVISKKTEWKEIEFKCKPGRLNRRPCIISPYHYRLDWLMWFSAFQNYQYNPWLLHLAGKVLTGDPIVQSLVEENPFEAEPPRLIRAQHYGYKYTDIGSIEAERGEWWKRDLIGEYFPPVSLTQLKPLLENQGWKLREEEKEN